MDEIRKRFSQVGNLSISVKSMIMEMIGTGLFVLIGLLVAVYSVSGEDPLSGANPSVLVLVLTSACTSLNVFAGAVSTSESLLTSHRLDVYRGGFLRAHVRNVLVHSCPCTGCKRLQTVLTVFRESSLAFGGRTSVQECGFPRVLPWSLWTHLMVCSSLLWCDVVLHFRALQTRD